MPDGIHGITGLRNRKVAFCGVMAGLSTAIMVGAGMLSANTVSAPLLAGTILLIAQLEFGNKAACCTWIVTAVITFALGISRRDASFYLFVGWWPIAKLNLDARIKPWWTRLLIKTAILTAAITVMFVFVFYLLGSRTRATLWIGLAYTPATLVCMLLYDCLLNYLSALYDRRLRRAFHSVIYR